MSAKLEDGDDMKTQIQQLARGWIAALRYRQTQGPGKMRDLVLGAYISGKPPPPRLDDPRAVEWIAERIAERVTDATRDVIRQTVLEEIAAALAGRAVAPPPGSELVPLPSMDIQLEENRINCLDLFSGAGGMSLGFQDAGYDVVAATDYDKDAAATYRRNFPKAKFIEGDITTDKIKDDICAAFKGRMCHVIIGGPECDAFSMAGKRDPKDARARLFLDYVELVRRLHPICCVMENVPGILSARTPKGKRGSVLVEVEKAFRGIGYQVEQRQLDASDFGVAQRRKRIIFITSGDRFAPIIFPAIPRPGAGPDAWGYTGIQRAIYDLADVPDGKVQGHVRTRHSQEFVERIRAARAAGKKQLGDYSEATRFPKAEAPAPTQKDNHGMADIHYRDDRVLTPREQARLQGFPDSFEFVGSQGSMRKQVCNAVPPDLAQGVAATLKTVILHSLTMNFLSRALDDATKMFGRRMRS